MPGIYRHNGCDLEMNHILPEDRKFWNFFPEVREEAKLALDGQGEPIRWHRFFHHLNSSQVFAFNLFYPILQSRFGSNCLAKITGLESISSQVSGFELIPDPEEGTNIDVALGSSPANRIFIEVKLSEGDFGRARDDDEHRKKFEETYRPRMTGKVQIKGMDEWTEFRRNYQFYRNVIFADEKTRIWFLIPGAHRSLIQRAERCMRHLAESIQDRVEIVQAEQFFGKLENAVREDLELSSYFKRFREKYAPSLTPVATSASQGR